MPSQHYVVQVIGSALALRVFAERVQLEIATPVHIAKEPFLGGESRLTIELLLSPSQVGTHLIPLLIASSVALSSFSYYASPVMQ